MTNPQTTPGDPQNFTIGKDNGNSLSRNQGTQSQLQTKTAKSQIDYYSNLGSENPFKKYGPKSLFYDGAKMDSALVTGNFLFYAFDGSQGNNATIQSVYSKSEGYRYNSRISSLTSKNPTASFLVSESDKISSVFLGNANKNGTANTKLTNQIIGGVSAPYYWKDFLYSKHYGKIPNNYMVTLRRFPSPMNDNLSLPRQITESPDLFAQGVGRPVSQIVTFVGGNTGNSFSKLLAFSTGLEFIAKEQDTSVDQTAYDTGLLKSLLQFEGVEKLIKTKIPDYDPNNTPVQSLIDAILGASTDEAFKQTAAAKMNYDMVNKLVGAKNEGGPLSSFNIFTSLDVITKTNIRNTGLKFDWDGIILNCAWELTSVGQVNTKAAMLDILGNILSMGTNYGNFISPAIRYNSEFPAIAFPGGDAGLEQFHRNPAKFFGDFKNNFETQTTGTAGGDLANAFSTGLSQLLTKLKEKNLSPSSSNVKKSLLERAAYQTVNYGKGSSWAAQVQVPQSILTGAPIGEWHMVIGNPLNPIAMIGNLICTKVDISFSDTLGPDDFPTEIKASFTMEHGRPRERGEIESIFNRGDGRLYQSVVKTQSNYNSAGSITTPSGGKQLDLNGKTLGSGYTDSATNNTGQG